MKPIEIKPGIYWVGMVDWNLRNFHGYSQTHKGTTYNAYLVIDDKITLFDTVDSKYRQEFLENISNIIDPKKIDYIVANHVEPDHSGSLPYVIESIQPEKIFISKMGKKFLEGRFTTSNWPLETVSNEQTISLGKRKVQFLETRMLHWPDSMVSYLPEEKLLISQDIFGQNIASSERFDSDINWSELKKEMAHYFANIILPFSPKVLKTIDKIKDLGWQFDMIAPDHGLILQSHIQDAINSYLEFAAQKPKPKAVIFYDTMWKSTEKMAFILASALAQEEIEVQVFHLKSWHHSDVMGEVWDSAAILAGSPTHNNGILPLVANMLTYMKGLRPQNKIGFAFGSYGWSGESPQQISDWLTDMGMEILVEPYKVKHAVSKENEQELQSIGKSLGQTVQERVRQF